jgi:hypothetical protein
MGILVGIALVVGWVLLKVVWGIASFAVHALLVAAAVAVIVHVARAIRGRRHSTTVSRPPRGRTAGLPCARRVSPRCRRR